MNLKHIAGEARVQICDYFTGNSVITLPQEQALLDSIILTAAAKIVRESGAVKALESCESYPDPSGRMVETHNEMLTDAALTALRALTEQKGE